MFFSGGVVIGTYLKMIHTSWRSFGRIYVTPSPLLFDGQLAGGAVELVWRVLHAIDIWNKDCPTYIFDAMVFSCSVYALVLQGGRIHTLQCS